MKAKIFKFRRRLTLHASGPITGIKWSVPASRRYRLIVDSDQRGAFLEYNKPPLPTVTVTADGVRKRMKL